MTPAEVSSSLARQLLEALNFNPRYDFDPQRIHLFQGSEAGRQLAEKPSGYRLWLREKLPHSGLATALPAGQDLLPDIYEDSPWLKSLAWLVKPRNYKELAAHLCRYLEWYVDRTKPVQTQRLLLDLLQSRRSLSIFGGLFLALQLGAATLAANSGPALSIAISGLFYAFLIFVIIVYVTGRGSEYGVNKEELFLYLREHYSDAPESYAAFAEKLSTGIEMKAANLPEVDAADGRQGVTSRTE